MQYISLIEMLQERKSLTQAGVTFIQGSNQEEFISYHQLYHAGLHILAILQAKGVKPQDELVFQITDNKNFIIVFWSCLLGGIIPVPLYVGQNDDHKLKVFKVWNQLNNPYLFAASETLEVLSDFANHSELRKEFQEIKRKTIFEHEMRYDGDEGKVYPAKENDIAFVQFSSGSTGSPKGVVLTHKNLIANMEGISNAANYTAFDSMISWMPLTHDMGLIGFHLNPLFIGMSHFIIPTNVFVRNPSVWLEKASAHKVTILCSPNFGYRYTLKHCSALENSHWDLSHVRILYNGAEPIAEKLCQEFLHHHGRYGLKNFAMCPVYGLAEASLAVSISGLNDQVISISVDRDKLNVGDVISVKENSDETVSFVNVGKAIKHCSIKITDERDVEVQDSMIGHIQIKGDNVTSCYYNNEIETKRVVSYDGWLKTGDLGFVRNGSLYVTGRSKDIIFKNGQNYYPHDIERVAEAVDGIELNRIVVAGTFNDQIQKDEVIAFVFHRGDLQKFVLIERSLRAVINTKIGIELGHIIPVKEIPKTTSGKLQRFKLLEQYKNGVFRDVQLELKTLLDSAQIEIEAPLNSTESTVLRIWRTILNENTLGVTQSFFELGGNSLRAAEMAMALLKEFNVELPIEEIYERQTIRSISEGILTRAKAGYSPMPVIEKQQSYPLSSAQKRLYYTWVVDPSSVAYNIPLAFQWNESPDIDKLEDCINHLTTRHEALRMYFHSDHEPSIVIAAHINIVLSQIRCAEEEIEQKLKSLISPFDLTQPSLFRIALLSTEHTNKYVLFVDFHHIISDGVSIYYFLNELVALYNGKKLAPLSVSYKDFVNWENNNIASERIKLQGEFWSSLLHDNLPILEMPLDFQRPPIFNTVGRKNEFKLSRSISNELRSFARKNHCSLHALLFTVYTVFISKYTNQDENIVGIPVAGRCHPDLRYVHGMFVNNLPIRNFVKQEESFLELLQRTKDSIANALRNQEYPFENIVSSISGKRDISRNPLFDTMFTYQNMGNLQREGDIILSRYFFDPGFSKFDISMEVFDEMEEITYYIEYAIKLFEEETILRMAQHFNTLIEQIINNPSAKIYDLTLLTRDEYADHVVRFNATEQEYSDSTIHKLFEAQARLTPDRIAIEYREREISYNELNEHADRLAFHLVSNGVSSNDVVAIWLERSPEFVISALAILKTGACFLPLDASVPVDRIAYIVSNSKSKLVISDNHVIERYSINSFLSEKIININAVRLYTGEIASIANRNNPNALAYIIYTSGTTGMPKGVMIEHRALVNYLTWAARHYIKGEEVCFPLYTSVSFDLTVTSIFAPLISGNKIVVYADSEYDLLLEQIIVENKANVIKLTPSHLRLVAGERLSQFAAVSKIKRFVVGGEQLDTDLAKVIHALFRGNIEIYNEYGPTEATVGCMIHQFNPDEARPSVAIGVPADNTQIYILDKFLKPVPVGVNGELYISGDGIARGYLFNEELTKQRFLNDPFKSDQKMYKTGDIARRLANGMIEYIGRYDHQVKINGYRIELAEIEHHVATYPDVTEALVVVKASKTNQNNLWAYYKCNKDIKETDYRKYLASKLPHYMVPIHFIRIEKIPLTTNGKIDYHALPTVTASNEMPGSALPKNAIESLSLKVWEDVLGENVNIFDNFFELGGDSIKAVQIVSRLKANGILLAARDILTYHTIDQISLHARMQTTVNEYVQEVITGERRLTPVESWFFSHKFTRLGYYNQSILLSLKREVSVVLVEEAFNKVIQQHDGLRINFLAESEKSFYNKKHLEDRFIVNCYSCNKGTLAETCEDIKGSFDIFNDLLMKAALIEEGGEKMLFITAHHLVIDGVSWRIFLEDFYTIYNALERGQNLTLSSKTASLIDWEKQLLVYAGSDVMATEAMYWNEIEKSALTIPLDFKTEDWAVQNERKISLSLGKEKTAFLLKGSHKVYKTDVPILMNTALVLALREWCGLNEFVIEQENHGRHMDTIDLSRTLGWFTSMYPVRFELKDDSIAGHLKAIKEQIKGVPNHGLGYGICKYMRKSFSHEHAMTAVRLNYLGQFDEELNNDLFCFDDRDTGRDVARDNRMTAVFELNAMVINSMLKVEWSYNNKAHSLSTVELLSKSFMNNLERILDHIKDEGGSHFTPSDFEMVSLDQAELDALF